MLDRPFAEGVRERIEDLGEDDIYYAYGRLIADGRLELDMDCLGDRMRLALAVARHRQHRSRLDW